MKETIEKAAREGEGFEPEGDTMRNYLTSVGNVEAAVGHYEEFAIKTEGEKRKFHKEMLDDARYLRQEMIKNVGENHEKLFDYLDMINDLMDRQVEFMRGVEDGEGSEGE